MVGGRGDHHGRLMDSIHCALSYPLNYFVGLGHVVVATAAAAAADIFILLQ